MDIDMTYMIIIKTEDDTIAVSLHKATIEQLSQWINQAPNEADRNLRKAIAHPRLYGNPQSIQDALKGKK